MTDRHTADTITSDALDTLYQRAERAEAALKRVRALAVYNRDHTAVGIDDYQIGQHELAVAVLDILQPGPAATLCPHGCDTTHCPCLACEDDQPGPAATQATQPEIITDRATIRAALDEPGCTCTYGNRCPNCRD